MLEWELGGGAFGRVDTRAGPSELVHQEVSVILLAIELLQCGSEDRVRLARELCCVSRWRPLWPCIGASRRMPSGAEVAEDMTAGVYVRIWVFSG